MAELIKIYPENPDARRLQQVVDTLKNGGLIVYPTDTVYGLGCDITNYKAVEKLCRLKKVKPEKARFSFICSDLSNLSLYVRPLSSNSSNAFSLGHTHLFYPQGLRYPNFSKAKRQ